MLDIALYWLGIGRSRGNGQSHIISTTVHRGKNAQPQTVTCVGNLVDSFENPIGRGPNTPIGTADTTSFKILGRFDMWIEVGFYTSLELPTRKNVGYAHEPCVPQDVHAQSFGTKD